MFYFQSDYYLTSRSLYACEGSILIVDSTQGVEAQTLANVYQALDINHEIIPVLNKIDLPASDLDRTKKQIEDVIGIDTENAVPCSGKTGEGINEILEAILFSFSYPPQGMTDKEFTDIKIEWLIRHDRINLIESFLKQNQQFDSKSKAVQYLVDKKIASGNVKEGCEKIKFIDEKIKDSYLEKFKI